MDLLESIAHLLDCRYLSDLHYATVTPSQLKALGVLAQNHFSLEEYNQAASYILGGCTQFETVEQAVRAIAEHFLAHANG